MAQKIPFFELFTDFSPDFDLRVPLNAAMVTNMVLEPEKRTMTLDMTVRAEMNDSTRETVEQLLARNYDLKRVDIHVKSTAEAFPDMLKNAGRKVSGSGNVIMGREIAKGRVLPISLFPRFFLLFYNLNKSQLLLEPVCTMGNPDRIISKKCLLPLRKQALKIQYIVLSNILMRMKYFLRKLSLNEFSRFPDLQINTESILLSNIPMVSLDSTPWLQ